MASQSKALLLDGPAGKLEVLAENLDDAPKAILLICHPHPQHGGSMHNKVVHTLARSGHDLGLATVRFNYRGVGQSEGEYAEGEGETQDLLALIDWLDAHFPAVPLWLAGFSFGAYVALRASGQRQAGQLILVAPAVNLLRFEGLQPPGCPWLLAMGTADEIVPFDQVLAWVGRQTPPPETLYFDGVGHFFHGHLVQLRQALKEKLSAKAERL